MISAPLYPTGSMPPSPMPSMNQALPQAADPYSPYSQPPQPLPQPYRRVPGHPKHISATFVNPGPTNANPYIPYDPYAPSNNRSGVIPSPASTPAAQSFSILPSATPAQSTIPLGSHPLRQGLSNNGSTSEFQVERPQRSSRRKPTQLYEVENAEEQAANGEALAFKQNLEEFLVSKNRLFAVSGSIPVDTSQLALFFRTASGISHCLDFPIDMAHFTPPSLDVLITACRPHQTQTDDLESSSPHGDYPESLFFPQNLALSTSLEIACHPILDTVRNTLFPKIPRGSYHLTTQRDKLELLVIGGRLSPQPRNLRNDGRSATIIVTLPVKFRGGRLIVVNPEGREESFQHKGQGNSIEWTALLADCDYEVETVTKGCRLMMSYGVFIKGYGATLNAAGMGLNDGIPMSPEPLLNPSAAFMQMLGNLINVMRGKKIAFYLTGDYGANPGEARADSLIPLLKGGDAMLYQAFKGLRIASEFHWTAGGYIWPSNSQIDIFDEDEAEYPEQRAVSSPSFFSPPGVMPTPVHHASNLPRQPPHSSRAAQQAANPNTTGVPPVQGMFGSSQRFIGANGYPVASGEQGDPTNLSDASGVDENHKLRRRVEESGGVALAGAEIVILNPANFDLSPGSPFSPNGWQMPMASVEGVSMNAFGNLSLASSPRSGGNTILPQTLPNPAATEIGKERVPYATSSGDLEKLVVNVMLVAVIP